MKKVLALLLICGSFAAAPAYGQTQNPVFTLSSFKFKPTPTNSTSAVTNTSADTVSLYLPGYYNIVGIQPVVSKVSGTVAGKVIIYGSIDGVDFVSTGDTLTLSNQATNQTIFSHVDPVWVYYRGIQNGGTTMASTMQIYYTARKL